jgi:hypothetical protein
MQKPLPDKGLPIYVLRTADLGDCTNNGISAQFDRLILLDEDIEGVFEPSEECPAVRIITRDLWRQGFKEPVAYLHLEPVDAKYHAGKWLMAGGNFGWTPDSRFPSRQPLSIHDRYEEPV